MNPEDRKALEVAREALIENLANWKALADSGDAGNWAAEDEPYYRRGKKALALIDERLQADAPKENPALDLSGLAYELEGVVIDAEQGGGFDDVCLRTIKRVRDALWGVQPAIDELTSRSQADEKEEPVTILHAIASYIEPHWQGAGLNPDCKWLFDEIVAKMNRREDEKEEPVAWCWHNKSLGRLSDCYGMHELPSDEDKERAAKMGGAIAYLYVGDAPLYAHGRKGDG